jgi:hypothetical protein
MWWGAKTFLVLRRGLLVWHYPVICLTIKHMCFHFHSMFAIIPGGRPFHCNPLLPLPNFTLLIYRYKDVDILTSVVEIR